MKTEDRYKILYETSRDAIMILAPPTWQFTAGNPATIKMFMAKNEAEFISKGPGDVSPQKQPDGQLSSMGAKKMIMKAMKTGSASFEWTHKRLNGKDFSATVLLARVEIDGKKMLQATVRDIAKEKEAELKLKEKVEELEKINNLMMGRELKMVELKKEIKKLKKILPTGRQE